MPAPPPYGASSTLRCLSCGKSRRSTMLYSTLPAWRAREGMLSPSGPAKNSGKIVTTLILRGTRSLNKAERFVDDDGPRRDIGAHDYFGTVWDEGTASWCPDVEKNPVREPVKRRHLAKGIS